MHTPSARLRRVVPLAVAPVAVLVAGLLVWQGSSAAFTAQTRNSGNNWQTGSVTLSDDDSGSARFAVNNLTPLDTDTKCITVTTTSSVAGVVKFYVDGLSSQGLQDYVHLVITEGTGGSFASCSGFIADQAPTENDSLALMATEYTSYATGTLPWVTTGNTAGESKVYKIQWTFETTGLTQLQIDALQGKSTGLNLVWELQST
jgi:hypothetical protein